MRHAVLASAVLALSAAALAGCDEDGHFTAPPSARTASASQCAPAPLPACPGARRATAVASTSTASPAGGHAVYVRTERSVHYSSHEGGGHEGGYRHVEHYGHADHEGGAWNQTREDAYATGTTMRSSRTVVSQSSQSSESGYSQSSYGQGGYAQGGGGYGYASSGSSGGYGYEGGAMRSTHQGRLIIRDANGQAESWTWRTAGHDNQGYLVWPGKSPR